MKRRVLSALVYFLSYLGLLAVAYFAGAPVYPHMELVDNVPAEVPLKKGQVADVLVLSSDRAFMENRNDCVTIIAQWTDGSPINAERIKYQVASNDSRHGELYGFGAVRLRPDRDGRATIRSNQPLPNGVKLAVQEPLGRMLISLGLIAALAGTAAIWFFVKARR
jgi:hypothetical protein